MKKENGFTLTETIVAVSLMFILSTAGLYGWNRWQQQQRLWQTASQVRDYLVFLRNDASRHNRDHKIGFLEDGTGGCLITSVARDCEAESLAVLKPRWPEISISDVTPSLGFYGLRDTAWAGRIRVHGRAGEWVVVVSNAGRIRMCHAAGVNGCR